MGRPLGNKNKKKTPRAEMTAATTTSKTDGRRGKRAPLAERVKKFDLDKLVALRNNAIQTLQVIAEEGKRRNRANEALRDLSVLQSLKEELTAEPEDTATPPVPNGTTTTETAAEAE